jgi:hypothetical protein
VNFLVSLGFAGMTLTLIFAAASRFLPCLPQQIVSWAAQRLADAENAERFGEEWEAELTMIDGWHPRLWYALGRLTLLPITAIEAWKGAREQRKFGSDGTEPPHPESKLHLLGRIPVDMVNPMPLRRSMDRRIRVGIIDTGVPQEHPAFDVSDRSEDRDTFVVVDSEFQRLLSERSDSPASPLDTPWEGPVRKPTSLGEIASHFGHGTFMTGLIRQTAPDSQVYSLRVAHNDGLAYEHDLVGALSHLADQVEAARHGDKDAIRVDVVVLAIAGVDEEPEGWIGNMIDRLTGLGVTVVVAAGNPSSDRPFSPAAFAAHERPEASAPISLRGPGW